jgi:inner membrane transporter RhtA
MSIAAMFAVPIGVYGASHALLDHSVLVTGFIVAVLSSAVPYLLEMFAFRRLSAGIAGVLLSAAPAISAIVGMAGLDERLTQQQWICIALITVGSGGCAIFSRRTSTSH